MSETKAFHPRKSYRRIIKKMQRKRKRQKLAQERDHEEELAQERDPVYQAKQRELLALQLAREAVEAETHRIQEEKWLETERLVQLATVEERKRLEALEEARKDRLREEEKLRARLRKEKEDRLARENLAFKTYQEQIELYTTGVRDDIPDLLQHSAQTNPSRETCGFFSKTSVCRYGDACVKNHIKPGISKILLIRNFFTHIRLEQSTNTEYGGDLQYEYEDGELQKAYDEFYHDAVYEIEKFGEIENFVTARQPTPHFRGNVFVEFKDDRDALRAFQGLIGRFYAGRQLTVEFSGINSFVQAICGKSFRKCCNQGSNCNFIHMFKNPGVKHKIDAFWLQMQWELIKKKQRTSERGTALSWDDTDEQNPDPYITKRNWRWSESPERVPKTKNTEIEPVNKRMTKNTGDKHHKRKKSRNK